MDDYKNFDNFQRTEGCKMISPHHFHPTNGDPWILTNKFEWGEIYESNFYFPVIWFHISLWMFITVFSRRDMEIIHKKK